MAAHLITGYKGSEHIQSKDARSFNTAMFGSGEFVMEIGNQLEASILDNNTIRILDGDILMQGGHIRIETDTYEDVTITTGTAGKNRNDLIVMTYKKNPNDGTETAYLEVLKGTESTTSATDPAYTSGNIASGATKNQMPLYRVKIVGVALSEIEAVFTTIPTYKTLAEQYAEEFEIACETHLGSLDVLDSYEEIISNDVEMQVAGALGVKEGFEQINSNLGTVEGKIEEVNSNLGAVERKVDALKLIKVSGTTPSSGSTEAKVCSLPSGCTINNCYIVSVDIEYSTSQHYMHYCDISTSLKNDGIYMNVMTRTSFIKKPVSFLLCKYE